MKNYIILGCIIVFLLFINYLSCHQVHTNPCKIDTFYSKIDTQWLKQDTAYIDKPRIIKGDSIPYPVYQPIDTSSKEVVIAQLRMLLKKYQSYNIYSDSVKLDSGRGYMAIIDTVHENLLQGRHIEEHFKFPKYTETITIKETVKPYRSLIFGGAVNLNQYSPLDASIIYKDRKDQYFQIKANTDFKTYNIGVGYYKNLIKF